MKRIIRGFYHRSPRWVQRQIVGIRGFIWKRQIPAFLNARRPAPVRQRPVSVVIPSYNDLRLLRQCLASLSTTLQQADEIIIVDDFCQEQNSAELLKLVNAQTRVILKDERGGFAKTVNRGMLEAQHDIVLLNSDIVALPSWAEFLQDAADSSNEVGLVSAKLLYPDGRIQYGGTFWGRSFAPQWFAHRFGGAKFNFGPSNVRRYNWGAGGACMYVTRAAYERLGGLDEEYWLGFEDVDYAMSAWTAGFSSLYEPDALLFHHESATRGYHQGNRELASMRTFWRKWRGLHDQRNIAADQRRIVIAADENSLWFEYAQELSRALNAPIERADNLSAEYPGVTLVLSESVFDAVWRSHARTGIAIALPREIPKSSSARVAAFQPEFDYIVRNEEDKLSLESGIGWPALSCSTPFTAVRSTAGTSAAEILIAFNANTAALKDELLRAYPEAHSIEVKCDTDLIASLRVTAPSVFVNLTDWGSELDAFAALASGSALIAPESSLLQSLLQNGLNCFTVPLSFDSVNERLAGLLSNPSDLSRLVQNATGTVVRARSSAVAQLECAISIAIESRAKPKN